jgi:hypothetical protein
VAGGRWSGEESIVVEGGKSCGKNLENAGEMNFDLALEDEFLGV